MTELRAIGPKTIQYAAGLVRKGGLIVYPTDTVYGLGCDPFNSGAVERLVQAKQRKQGRLPLLVNSLEEAEKIGRFEPLARRLANSFWPGPLTLVVPLAGNLPFQITDSSGSVGLRVPGRDDTIRIVEACGGAIVGTSANLSGAASPTSAAEAMRQLEGRVDLVLDGGDCAIGVESSVVKIAFGHVEIVREGAVGREAILEACDMRRVKLETVKHSC